MKRIAALVLGLFLSASAFALPIGNPWEASLMRDGVFWERQCDCCNPCLWDAWSIRFGFYGDYVYNHKMELDKRGHATIHKTEITTNAAYLALNFFDRFDLFGTLGASHFKIVTPDNAFGGIGITIIETIETETDFSWSLGLRATIWECGNLGLGAEAQYFRTCPNINYVKNENNDPIYPDDAPFRYHAWQLGLGAAYTIPITSCATALVPYLGIKFERAWVEMNNFQAGGLTFFDLRTDGFFGYAFGMTLLGCNKTSVTVEARYLNEKALYVNGQVRF